MRLLLVTVLALVLVVSVAASVSATQVTLAITQVWQHKDTSMNCLPGASAVAHAWNHATTCIHCGTYCAPASASMFALFMGRTPPFTNQDDIYDNSKLSGGETLGNNVLETHGLGMYPGLAGKPPEIQTAFQYAVGIAPVQYGPQGTTNPLLSCEAVVWYIDNSIPVYWVDMGTWPEGQTTLPDEIIYDSGHCKIIAGYDDMDTPENCDDDQFLIYDPWPLSGSPYWKPATQVLDPLDVYLTTMWVNATEESSWGSIKKQVDGN